MQKHQGLKYIWRLPEISKEQVYTYASQFNISVPIAHTLLARGYTNPEKVRDFLFGIQEPEVLDTVRMKDAQKAVDRIIHALKTREKILVFGDYDVDGITSTSLMMMCLLPLEAQVNFYLPHRVKDGYGLSTKIVERAADNGYTLIITVDNGITAFEPVEHARKRGLDVIITDHHRPHDKVPEAFAIINPNQDDCDYPFKYFAGVGVAFKIMHLLYKTLGKELPTKVYELLLLGTVADVVPLLDENRFWVRECLNKVNKQHESYSFKVLKQNGGVTKEVVTSTDIGFSITPQINALGRLEDPRQGVKFLIGSDKSETDIVGKVLLELNHARREIERSITQEIMDQVDRQAIDVQRENVIIAASSNWPPGVIGLVASRIVSAYGKPTILLHITKEGVAKGSCRSIPEFNMFNALAECKDLLLQFGGHSLAAGLSLSVNNVKELKDRLEHLITQQLSPDDLVQKLDLDAALTLQETSKKLLHDLSLLEPFGNANNIPRFLIQNVNLIEPPSLLKDVHVKCRVFSEGVIKPVIFFNRPDIFKWLLEQQDRPFNIAAEVLENHWQGKVAIELRGLDVSATL